MLLTLVSHRFYILVITALSIFIIPQESFATHTEDVYLIEGQEVPCFATTESGMCGFFTQPWDAIKHALFVDYLGDWFIAIVYFPLIAVIFALTKNGTWTGLVGLFIVATTNIGDTIAIEITLPLVAISGGLGFYEVIRKRVME